MRGTSVPPLTPSSCPGLDIHSYAGTATPRANVRTGQSIVKNAALLSTPGDWLSHVWTQIVYSISIVLNSK